MHETVDGWSSGSGAEPVPALIVSAGERRRLTAAPWSQRLILCSQVGELEQLLKQCSVAALLCETRDVDGAPVPAALRGWLALNPRAPVIIWTAGSGSTLREILELTAAGGDVRLILRPRDDLIHALDPLLQFPHPPHPGAVPALLSGVVLAAPAAIQPELAMAVYHAWPTPSVQAWANAVDLTRQALNRRLAVARYANASVVLDHFSGAEIATRLTLGLRLRQLAAAMHRSDDRSLRRRLGLLGARPEYLRDDADFRSLIPRIIAGIHHNAG